MVGLGYVGLPLAYEAQKSGLKVTGLDVNADVVSRLNDGSSHIDDITDEQIQDMLKAGFSATTKPTVIAEAATVIICVPTPLSTNGGPDLAHVEHAATVTSEHLQPGQLVVLESTTYPGTTEEVLIPILEKSGMRSGSDFYVAFSRNGSIQETKHSASATPPRLLAE